MAVNPLPVNALPSIRVNREFDSIVTDKSESKNKSSVSQSLQPMMEL
jgi:hypothetical protein